jgi:hypothetical protein
MNWKLLRHEIKKQTSSCEHVKLQRHFSIGLNPHCPRNAGVAMTTEFTRP